MIQVLLIKGGFSILLDIFHFMQLQVGYWIHLFLLSALWWEGGLMPALCNFYFIGVHGRWSSHPHLVWTFYSSLQVTPEHVLGLIFFKIWKAQTILGYWRSSICSLYLSLLITILYKRKKNRRYHACTGQRIMHLQLVVILHATTVKDLPAYQLAKVL